MTMFLIQDAEYFEAHFPSASAFLTEAKLRKECYQRARAVDAEMRVEWDAKRLKRLWVVNRLLEIIRSPACREPWFVKRLKHETNIDAFLSVMREPEI